MKAAKWLLAAGALALAFAGCRTETETEYVDRVVEKEVEKNYAAAPAFTVGDYDEENGTLSVSITTATEDATIYYTTDGSDPTTQSTAYYETAITVSEDTIIKAFAAKSGMENSPVSVAKVSIAERQVDGEASAGVTTHDAVAVYHWQQNTNGVAYTNADHTTREVAAGTKLSDLAQTYNGFTAKGLTESQQADGTYIVHVWYDRNLVTVTVDANGGTVDGESTKTYTGLYGTALNVTLAKEASGTTVYFVNGAETALPGTYPAENATYTVAWASTEVAASDGFIKVEGSTVTGGTAYKSSDNDYIFVANRTVEIDSFYISDHEVTQAEYETYCKYGSSIPSAGYGKGDSFPAYYVNWYDAIVYCNLRSMAARLEPVYAIGEETDPSKWANIVSITTDGVTKYCGPSSSNTTWNGVTMDITKNGYRLPTEAEWEYAARGGKDGVASETQYTYAGSDDVGSVAWYTSNSGSKTHEVKGKNANALGIYDMSGNVWEWCWDWYSSNISSTTPASGASSGSNRVYRGGSWCNNARSSSVSGRDYWNPFNRYGNVGFRVVRSAQ